MGFRIDDIAVSHTLRGKWWTYVELLRITQKLPSELKFELAHSDYEPIDPFWLLTQSAKNYQTNTPRLLERYKNSHIFKPIINDYGCGTTLSTPAWLSLTTNSEWYWHRVRANRIAHYISTIPGVKHVYLVGSGSLKLANSSSDIDFALECYPLCCSLVRLYIKIYIKIIRQDVHSFFRNQRTKIGKIDAGLYFEKPSQIFKHHVYEPRQLSLVMIEQLDALHYLQWFITLIFLPIHAIFWVASWLQIPFYKYVLRENDNLIFDYNFISFLPKYYADKKFNQLNY